MKVEPNMTDTHIASQGGVVATIKRRPTGKAWPAYDLLPRINRVLVDRAMLASRFGRRACNDPHLVDQIEAGRRLRLAARVRVETYLRRLEWLASMKGEA